MAHFSHLYISGHGYVPTDEPQYYKHEIRFEKGALFGESVARRRCSAKEAGEKYVNSKQLSNFSDAFLFHINK